MVKWRPTAGKLRYFRSLGGGECKAVVFQHGDGTSINSKENGRIYLWEQVPFNYQNLPMLSIIDKLFKSFNDTLQVGVR